MTWYAWNATGPVLTALYTDKCLSIAILCEGTGDQKTSFTSLAGGGSPYIALVKYFPLTEATLLWTGMLSCTWGLVWKQEVSKRLAKRRPRERDVQHKWKL